MAMRMTPPEAEAFFKANPTGQEQYTEPIGPVQPVEPEMIELKLPDFNNQHIKTYYPDKQSNHVSIMNTDELKAQLASVDTLVTDGIIDKKKGDAWKERIIAEFEGTAIPPEKPKPESTDLAHLPGRMVGGFVSLLGAIARGSGATYEGLSKREGYMNQDGSERKQTKRRSPDEMMDDLPDIFRNKRQR